MHEPVLHIRFKINLDAPDRPSGRLFEPGLHGVQFHRWFPDGDTEALLLHTSDSTCLLKVWFEVHGCVKNGLLEYQDEEHYISPSELEKQGRIDSGPLYGLLQITSLPADQLTAAKNHDYANPAYEKLVKKVVKLIYPNVNRLIGVIQTRFGQYWLPSIHAWDSRIESASVYMRHFGIPEYSTDGGTNWQILPQASHVLSFGNPRRTDSYTDFITSSDWQTIQAIVNESQPNYQEALEYLYRAIEHFDYQRWRYAVIESVTALEMTLSISFRYLLTKSADANFDLDTLPFWLRALVYEKQGNSDAKEPMHRVSTALTSSFDNLKLTDQIELMAKLLRIDDRVKENTLVMIRIRNELLHEGKSVNPGTVERSFEGMLSAFAALLHEQVTLRFPMGSSARKLF